MKPTNPQTESIVNVLEDVPMKPEELPMFLMFWIEDISFDRAAICEAAKIIKQRRGWTHL